MRKHMYYVHVGTFDVSVYKVRLSKVHKKRLLYAKRTRKRI